MVVAGLMSPSGAPGPYDVFIPATVVIERTVRTGADGTSSIGESWEFQADDGNLIEVQLEYIRGTPKISKSETKVFSAAKPDFFRIYRVEQGVDVARSTGADTDRVTEFSFKASGEKLAPLFDGSEQLISVTSVPWYSRQLYLPAS